MVLKSLLQFILAPTGIAVEMPSGCEGQVRGRSGWTQKGLIVPIGTIDNHYRSEGNSVQCQQG